ncbi:MAG: ergothioneine biosynthesis protein EgtB [Gemmatimonadales bacterium]
MTSTATVADVTLDGLVEQYRQVRGATERLCEPLAIEDYVVQSMTDASPTRWHLAHTTWFFETLVLRPLVPDYRSVNDTFQYLFNSYYNTLGDQFPRPQRGLLTRPTVEEVMRYRAHVDRHMIELFESSDLRSEIPVTVVLTGLNHEQQHQELMVTDLKHMLSHNPLHPVYRDAKQVPDVAISALDWVEHAGGLVEIGFEGDGFAYDNEQPRHRVYLEPFRVAPRLVTCGEYLEFMQAGGYARPEYWLSDGWAAVGEQGWCAPLYWTQQDGQWMTYTLGGLREVNPAEPICHVSYYEADAYARWAGARLPTEAEWETVAKDCEISGNFVEAERFHPVPSAASSQMFGDVWEWTASSYSCYPGYQRPDGALGEYNAKFTSGQMVLRGGSCATPKSHIRPTYRNFFPPSARWQFAGIRLAR